MANILKPLERLPREEWEAYMIGARTVALSIHHRENYRYWIKLSIFDFPNDFVSEDDLVTLGIMPDYIAAISQL